MTGFGELVDVPVAVRGLSLGHEASGAQFSQAASEKASGNPGRLVGELVVGGGAIQEVADDDGCPPLRKDL